MFASLNRLVIYSNLSLLWSKFIRYVAIFGIDIILPELGEGIEHVEISEILVSEGDTLEKDDPIIIVETGCLRKKDNYLDNDIFKLFSLLYQ